MFGKVKAGASATDAYVVAMIGALLEEHLGDRVYITQYRLNYGKELEGSSVPLEVKQLRRFANRARAVDVVAAFAHLGTPRTYGHEGVPQVLPVIRGRCVLTSETNGWVYWEMLSMNLNLANISIGGRALRSVSVDEIAGSLKELSNELRHRAPKFSIEAHS